MRNNPYDNPTYWQPSTKASETSQWVSGLDEQLKNATHRAALPLPFEPHPLQICLTTHSFWLLFSFGKAGQLAIRTCFDPQSIHRYKQVRSRKNAVEYEMQGSLGTFRVKVERPDPNRPLIRYTTSLKPEHPFTVQAFPRDLYVLDGASDPLTTEGLVYVSQTGPTAGLTYFSAVQPEGLSVVYLQNFTALAGYFEATQTDPTDTVDVQWPEAGFSLPASEKPLVAGQELVLSDAFLYLSDSVPQSEFAAADQFLDVMAGLYLQLPKPETDYYHWPKTAERSVQALTDSPHCGRRIGKQYYLNAYVDATQKPPESMVQLAILVPLLEYREWLGKPVPLADSLLKNLPSFYDETHETIMRWLPSGEFKEQEAAKRSEEQDPQKVDSWYLLHTLMNLGRLAEKGDLEGKALFFRSLEYAIRAAHHFGYDWPVFYDIRTLEVVKAETDKGKGGELDVAGLYTHVMLQAYELTRELRYLNEAVVSAERLRGKGFELLYQTNITLMSALTLAKLWRNTGNRLYFDQSRLCVANVVARMWIWEGGFGLGKTRSTFMGVSPLRDAPYLAAYEEAEIFATMHNYLKEVNQDLSDPTRLLFSEYFKYVLHRGRFYYPSELPADTVCQQPREGRVIRDLPIPLEDMPTGWTQAGEVGQEVYGGALAYILTTYAYKEFRDVPVVVFSDYPIDQAEFQLVDKNSGYIIIRLAGTADGFCRLRLLAKNRTLPDVQLVDGDDPDAPALKPAKTETTYVEYQVRGHQRLRVEWKKRGA
ncbi:hypothetical protein [Larkinella ripae]